MYVHGRSRSDLESERPLQHLLIRNLEILGEAASRVSGAFREVHPEVPWRDLVDMRNKLIHAYFDINLNIIWGTIEQDLPPSPCQPGSYHQRSSTRSQPVTPLMTLGTFDDRLRNHPAWGRRRISIS